MSKLEKLVREIYVITTEELSSNCHTDDHIDYILYRINGGRKSEESWYTDK